MQRTKARLVPVLLSLLLVGCFMAANAVGQEPQKRDQAGTASETIQRLLKTNDKDGDGKISRQGATGPLKQFFDRVDANNDGQVDEAELKTLAERLRGQRIANKRRSQQKQQPVKRKPVAVPKGVQLLTDIPYRDGNTKWQLDLAMPEKRTAAPGPSLVFVHGGGWRGGDKGIGQWRSLPLQYASKGYVCISVNYRLTDEAPFPACVADVKCAVRWLRAHADQYNVDPKRIGAYGNSAGAHLVAMLGLVGVDAQLEGDGPYQDQSSQVQAVCCSATPTDFSNWGGPGKSFRGDSTFLRGPTETLAQRKKKASPISHARPDAPPFLIIHGTADATVPFMQGETFAEALKKAGAKDVTFLTFDGAGHGVFGQHSKDTGPAMEKFFARVLKP